MIILEYPFFTIEECEEIKRYAYKKEAELKEKTTTTNQYNNSITTGNYNQYNFLRDNPIYADRLVNLLKEKKCPMEWPILVQSWVNIYRKGDGIGWLPHQGNGFSFNIFIDGDILPGPVYLSTGYECGLDKYEMRGVNFENKKGDIQIFRSNTYHKVDPVVSERISVGGTLQNYSDISKDLLKDLSFNNKKESDTILLS